MPALQENNLDIGGRLIWRTSPVLDYATREMPPFIVAESGRFNARPKFYSRREGKDGTLILYTETGRGLLKYRGGEHELAPGSAALIDCFQPHEYRTLDATGGEWSFYWLHFFSENANFYAQLIYRDAFSVLDLGAAPLGIFDDVLKNLQYGDNDSLMTLSDSVYKTLALMLEASRREKTGRARDADTKETISKAVEFIRENYWMPLVLDDVAKHIGMSKFHFLRVFKDFVGTTPYRYLIAERVNVSKQLLLTTDLQVYEISVMVGFRDDSNFIRTFKSATGMTPQTFRSQMVTH